MRPVLALSALILAVAAPVLAHQYSADGLLIDHPWSRPAAAGGTAAGYAAITNAAATPLIFAGVTTAQGQAAEIHQTVAGPSGVMSMRPLRGGVIIPPRSIFTLRPGGYHIMILGLKSRTTSGQQFPAVFHFRRDDQAFSVPVAFAVEASPPAEHDEHAGH